jgi:phage terminase small subunit
LIYRFFSVAEGGHEMTQQIPKPPAGLRRSGRAMWRSVLGDFELTDHEQVILRECCRTLDTIDGLQQVLEDEGFTSTTSQGKRVHPSLAELRQQRLAFARLVSALRIPLDDVEGRTQSRPIRGVYGLDAS